MYLKLITIILTTNLRLCASISKHPIILITAFDGFRYDYFKRGFTPILEEIRSNGTKADYMTNQYPTITFPNFHSMATGMYPEVHGVLGNSAFDEKKNCLKYGYDLYHHNEDIIPIWNLNEKTGDERYSGVMMWPGCDLKYQSKHPTFFRGYDNLTAWQTRVDTVLGWILHNATPANLVLLYFEEPDFHGHHFGPDSDEVNQQLIRINNITGYLLDQLTSHEIRDAVNLFFLADHGMAAIKPGGVTDLNSILDPEAYTLCSGSPALQILPQPGKEQEVFKNLTTASLNLGNFNVYEPNAVPERWHYKNCTRNIAYLLESKIHYVFQDAGNYKGDHGYDNKNAEMHPMFFAQGPLIKLNYTIKPFQNIDLYPLIAHILNLTEPPAHVTPNGTLIDVLQILRTPEQITPNGALNDLLSIPKEDSYEKYKYQIL